MKVLVKKMEMFLLLMLIAGTGTLKAQDTIKFETIKSIKDIPHATLTQKWMWIHRSIVFGFLKERAPTHDTTYYTNYNHKTVITIPVSTRFINFKLRDGASSHFLQYQPNNQYDIGISLNTQFASFLVNTGMAVSHSNDAVKGKTQYKDYQFNLYGKKSTIDMSLQTYKGFYVDNARDFVNFRDSYAVPYDVRPDVGVFALNLNYYHLLNHKRFSYRSSFAFNGRQKKSAGSLLLGGYTSLFGINAGSSLVSAPFLPYFDSTTNIKNASLLSFGLNIGYIYTLIIQKKMYATFCLVQGIGASKTGTTRVNNSIYEGEYRLSSKQNIRFALGYDNENFFLGTMGMFDFYQITDKERSSFNYGYGKFRVFAGYRFSIEKQQRKLLQKLNLIDYRL